MLICKIEKMFTRVIMPNLVRTVHVVSNIPNLLEELQLSLPKVLFKKIETDDPTLNNAEIIVGDFDIMAPHIYRLPNLKWLQGTWAGLDKLTPHLKGPLPFLLTRFSNHRFGQIMSEYIITHIITIERDLINVHLNQQKQEWSKSGKISDYRTISDLSIGIMGLGTIGSWIGQCLSMLGAKILGYGRKPSISPHIEYMEPSCYYTKSNLPEFLKNCDYIINVLPTTTETTGLLNGTMLKNCEKRKTVFINVGRGTIIDEVDLVLALENGWLSKAVLDVFLVEPLPKENPLWTMEQVLITPHVSAQSRSKHIAEHFKVNLGLYESSKPLLSMFSLQDGY